jgi:hypothetical protein
MFDWLIGYGCRREALFPPAVTPLQPHFSPITKFQPRTSADNAGAHACVPFKQNRSLNVAHFSSRFGNHTIEATSNPVCGPTKFL